MKTRMDYYREMEHYQMLKYTQNKINYVIIMTVLSNNKIVVTIFNNITDEIILETSVWKGIQQIDGESININNNEVYQLLKINNLLNHRLNERERIKVFVFSIL